MHQPRLIAPLRFTAYIFLVLSILQSGTALAEDWPMYGRDRSRNPVSPEKNAPSSWDTSSGRNIKWKAKLGVQTFGDPVIANGLVWIGTTTEDGTGRPPLTEELAVLKCFRESDGKLMYEYIVSPKAGMTRIGVKTFNGSPLVEEGKLWFTTLTGEVHCLDIEPLIQRGEAVKIWRRDMAEEFGVFPRYPYMADGRTCSIAASYKNRIYVITGNGVGPDFRDVPAPEAPSLICFDKETGKELWTDNSPGDGVLYGQWGSPLVAEINGRGQVITPQGDGWLRSFDALTGELIWKLNINTGVTQRQDRNHFLAAPVLYENKVYIAGGQSMEEGEGPRQLFCIDPTKAGDISPEVEKNGKAGPNENSGVLWSYAGIERCRSLVAIHEGLLVANGLNGFVRCLDARSGQVFWEHDTRSQVYGSPLIVDGKVYVTTVDGEVFVFAFQKEKSLLTQLKMPTYIFSSPVYANGALYIAASETLYAISSGENDASISNKAEEGYWPQWRGAERNNISPETGLLHHWPDEGPTMLWTASGLGQGIHTVSIAGGRLYTLGNTNESEFAIALNAGTGDKIWATSLGKTVPENPLMRWLSQRCPTVDGDRIYILSMNAEVFCLDSVSGAIVWQRSYENDFGSKRPVFGIDDNPLVDGERLICTPFAKDEFIVALNKRTGEVEWRTKVDPLPNAGYASVIVSEAGGVRQYVVVHGKGLSGFAAANGAHLWDYARGVRVASSQTPLIREDLICAPGGYGGGLALMQVSREGNQWKITERYHVQHPFDAFQDNNTLVGEHIYTTRNTGLPACFEFTSGKLLWDSRPLIGTGRIALTYADGHLYMRHANGIMTLVQARPDEYRERGTFAIPGHEPASGVTYPVIAGRKLYIRDSDRLHCYDISSGAVAKPSGEARRIQFNLLENADTKVSRGGPRLGTDRAPDAIFVATPSDIVSRMLEMANVRKGEVVVDLGSGDGRVLIAAAKQFGARAVGYEIDERLVLASREAITASGMDGLASVEHADIFTRDLRNANVVTVFLYPHLMERLVPQFKNLMPGSRIVSHQFEMPGIEPDKIEEVHSKQTGETHRILLWTVPLRAK